MVKETILVGGLVLFTSCARVGLDSRADEEGEIPGITADPDEAKIISSDLNNFWYAFDRATPENDFLIYQEEYLRRGSPGLKEFMRQRITNLRHFVLKVQSRPRYYGSIRNSTMAIDSSERSVRLVYHRLKDVYPDAIFPPLYFLIGPMNAAGITIKRGMLIGTELFGKTTSSPFDELNPWEKSVIKSMDRIPLGVAHELIHYQQRYPREATTVLERSIAEGSADFLSELIAGGHLHELQHRYGEQHEQTLLVEFRRTMNERDLSRWLYNGGILAQKGESNERPADLGYYIGYKICRAYYEQSADKTRAFAEILNIHDFEEFLLESGYGTPVTAGHE